MITGLSRATLLAVIIGQRRRRTRRRGHATTVTALVRLLTGGRWAAIGDGSRDPSIPRCIWTQVSTSQGLEREIDILADLVLASEQLAGFALRTLSLDVGGRDYKSNDDTTCDACNDKSDDRDQPFIDGPDLDVFCPSSMARAASSTAWAWVLKTQRLGSVRRGSYAAA